VKTFGNQFVTLPGWIPGGLIGVKMVGVFPGNAELQ
jgi:ornithine cyclodeaminase